MTTKYFAVHGETGEVLSSGSYVEGIVDDPLGHLGPDVVVSDALVSRETHYVANGEIRVFPEKPSPDSAWDWAALSWRINIETVRARKSAEISQACQSEILAGFESSALDVDHHYPAKMTDQQNLASSVLASLLPGLPEDWITPFWCADGEGVWEFRPHTAMQIQRVGQDAKIAILTAMAKNETLQAALAAAETFDELENITW